MAVPFIDLKRYETGFLDSWNAKIAEMTREARFIGGTEVADLEKRLSSDNSVPHAITCANGTDALQLALRAAGIGRGDTVLIPDSTFWATFEAVVNVGSDAVTIDIDRTDLQMDFELFKKAVAQYRPRAAIIVHLYGWGSARLDEYRQFCAEQKITLIEDGAQAYGVSWKGKSIYADALVSTISFYPAKVLGGAGDGGAVLTRDAELAEKIRSLANHGREQHYSHGLPGWNSRLDSFQAAFLNLSLQHLSARLASRRASAEEYRRSLSGVVPTIVPPSGYVENGYLNVCMLDPSRRSSVETILKEKGIGFGNVYPGAVSDQKGTAGYLKGTIGGENARWLSSSVLNLPLFAYMKPDEMNEVLSVISGIFKK